MKLDIPEFIKPFGYHMIDHYKQLKEGEGLIVVPNAPKDGKGYTTKAIKLSDLK